MITCDKCKTVNPPDQRHCQNCNRDLLPGTSFAVRIIGFIFCLLIAALSAWVLYRMYKAETLPDIGCFFTSPIWWGLMAIGMPIGGLVFLLKRTPDHERYCDRAKRHLALDRDQALADINEAIRLAPEKLRAPYLKVRADLLERMGQGAEALRDRIAVAENPAAHDGGGDVAEMFGADKGIFVENLRKQDRAALVNSGALAVGYCPACRAAVQLDEKSRCKIHPKRRISDVRLAVPLDFEKVKAEVAEKHKKDNRKVLIGWIVVIVGVIILCVVFNLLGGNSV